MCATMICHKLNASNLAIFERSLWQKYWTYSNVTATSRLHFLSGFQICATLQCSPRHSQVTSVFVMVTRFIKILKRWRYLKNVQECTLLENIRLRLNWALDCLYNVVILSDYDIFITHFIINILVNKENWIFTQSSCHVWNYMVKKSKLISWMK